MVELKQSYKDFLIEMQQDNEAAGYGFELLAKKVKSWEFFDEILTRGLISASKNPEPIKSETDDSYQIPYWRALDYLEVVAKYVLDSNDLVTGEKLTNLIKDVSIGKDDPRGPQHNSYTFNKFTEILALLPYCLLSEGLILEVKSWVLNKFDRDLVVVAICTKLLPRLLESPIIEQKKLAIILIDSITSIKWEESNYKNQEVEPRLIVNDYWLNEFSKKYAALAGQRLGKALFKLLRNKLNEAYKFGTRVDASWLFRPAIEDNPQNHQWHNLDNLLVEMLRDSLSAKVSANLDDDLLNELISMYREGIDIERRIAIYIFHLHYEQLGQEFIKYIDAKLFRDNCLHETYLFLQERFTGMDMSTKLKIFNLINGLLDVTNKDIDTNARILRKQCRWLNAIEGKGCQEVDDLYANLVANTEVGQPPEQPDFFSYMTSWSGPGPSKYSVDEILFFLDKSILTDKLNTFQSTDEWRGPTKRALVDCFEEAIKLRPKDFIAASESFQKLQRPYQYGFLNAFSEIWSTERSKPSELDWIEVWPKLLNWIELLFDKDFWLEDDVQNGDLTPSKNWIPPLVAELIKAGAREDEHAFEAKLLPQAFKIISEMLKHLPMSLKAPEKDPMHFAINDSRGRVLDALFILTLRWCRVSDVDGDHKIAWSQVEKLFTFELRHSNGKNYEFSTLAANYCSHIQYMSSEWFNRNQKYILNPSNELNFRCAVNGLAYAPANMVLYEQLQVVGTIERALALPDLEDQSREKILERIALAYLWKQETLETKQMKWLYLAGREDDLATITSFFWSVSNQDLDKDAAEAVLAFWRNATDHALIQNPKNEMLLAKLSKLICYLTTLDEKDTANLIQLAQFVKTDHSSYFFARELRRLVSEFPKKVAEITYAYFQANGPDYDYEKNWLEITTTIAPVDDLKLKALEIIEIMRDQQGFRELYQNFSK